MTIRSISDFNSFSLYIFDLDNTIYKEEDYLYQAYKDIAVKFAELVPSGSEEMLFKILLDIYQARGRKNLFDQFLEILKLDNSYIQLCLNILRSFKPEKTIEIDETVKSIISTLISQKKKIFVLTNGNAEQQKNKIRNINWSGLDHYLQIVFANEIEPKPSSAGVEYILNSSNTEKNNTILIGDSEVDKACAFNSGIRFININHLRLLY